MISAPDLPEDDGWEVGGFISEHPTIGASGALEEVHAKAFPLYRPGHKDGTLEAYTEIPPHSNLPSAITMLTSHSY